ncbi:MAG: hypothetical protein IKE91_07040 [Clostridia bacterium]|nr:hypothetical protein [Clostridia bacterium]
MTRAEKIENKIKTLKAQLQYWEAELQRAKVSEEKDALIFQEVPAKVRNMFSNMQELRRFCYGQHDGKGVPVSQAAFAKAITPYQRLSALRGIGDSYVRETLKVLGIPLDADTK